MSKKQWMNPELKGLEFVETHTVDCSCTTGEFAPLAPKHPCHKTGNGDHNDNGNHGGDSGNSEANPGEQGHVVSTECSTHTFCCCYTVPSHS